MNKKLSSSTDHRQLQQIIAGLSEGVILIEPSRRILWANEAALTIHGITEIKALGGTAAGYRKRYKLQYRNGRRLAVDDYPLDRVLAGEEFSDVVVEVRRTIDPESHWVHQARSLILTDSKGDTDCFALVVNDISEQTSAEERFEQAFNANPAPALICRLSDFRYVRVNQGFLEMSGYAKEDIIDHTVGEIDVFEALEGNELVIERLNEGRKIPQMEANLHLPGGGTKLVIMAGQPIDVGEEACVLFTFMDLEPRRQAEDALRQSEARFAKSFRLMPVPTAILASDNLHILDVNDAFSTIFGYEGEEVIGRSAVRLGLLDDPAVQSQLEQGTQKKSEIRNRELQARTKEGIRIECLISTESLTIQNQPCLLVVLQDISERKRTETDLLNAIEAVMHDTSWFSRTVIEKLANIRTSKTDTDISPTLSDLTVREREVLTYICRGYADKQIATELKVSVHTIRNHVSTIYSKLNVHKRGAAIIWARERGLIRNDSSNPKKHGE